MLGIVSFSWAVLKLQQWKKSQEHSISVKSEYNIAYGNIFFHNLGC